MAERMGHDPIQFEGLSFRDLFQVAGLHRLDEAFLLHLREQDPDLHRRLLEFRRAPTLPPAQKHGALLLELAPYLEGFISSLFGIEAENAAAAQATVHHNPVFQFKKEFVQKRARHLRGSIEASFAELDTWLEHKLDEWGLDTNDRELAVSQFAVALLADPQAHPDAIAQLTRWCALARVDPEGQRRTAGWMSFALPERVDPSHLVPVYTYTGHPMQPMEAEPGQFRRRDGFRLTDPRMSAREVQNEIHYCVYCHYHEGDFCSRGFPEKKGKPELGFKVSPNNNILHGCPLDEKVSEMHVLKRDGYTLAALAMVMVDNPMVPSTGHRICNDCMKSCIYQKQTPVNIPQIETRVLTDVLDLPWGVEIYDLLTRWNPLRHRQYLPKPYNGRKVLIAGMGPAGFTMAHHLTMEGCAVVGIDGLKIEPLPEWLSTHPVRHYQDLVESLDERTNYGFGGVAEYGITVRWDKNFLKLIYLSLLRRPTFQVFGGVRFGGTITLEAAWSLGFHHVCNASGAGLPKVIPMGNSLARGMRQANDFLMALQLTGAAKSDSLANLQVRLPAVVIGGGLTAIDTATELQAYYIVQVEKALTRYERLVQVYGEEEISQRLDEEHHGILEEFLSHGRAVREERRRADAAGATPNFIPLLRSWGGVTIAYRRRMNESPAYQRNHEEVIKALQEGIFYVQGLEPLHAILDDYGHVKRLECRRRKDAQGNPLFTPEDVSLPARSILVAAGTVPNIIYEREHPGSAALDGNQFRAHVYHHYDLQAVQPAQHCKDSTFGPFTSYAQNGRFMTFIGDTHPAFQGSVVKAIASAARSYPQIMEALDDQGPAKADEADYARFREHMEYMLRPQVEDVRTDHPAVVELRVRAPLAARNFRPGQFFRLQSFEKLSPVVGGTRLQLPLQTVSGAGVEGDMIRLFILKNGAYARLAARLRPGDPVVLMGPSGAPTEMGHGKTIMVVAGRWGAAVMLALGPALRAAGNRVLYIGAFRNAREVYCQQQLEIATDQIVWATASGEPVSTNRPQDVSVISGNVVELLRSYGEEELGSSGRPQISLDEVDEALVMGSTGLLRALQGALQGELQDYFKRDLEVMGTVGSPMQCMLQGVCAQCLQWQINPYTGQRTRAVFSCAEQDQPLFSVDLENLWDRQTQNRLADQLADLWLSYLSEHVEADLETA